MHVAVFRANFRALHAERLIGALIWRPWRRFVHCSVENRRILHTKNQIFVMPLRKKMRMSASPPSNEVGESFQRCGLDLQTQNLPSNQVYIQVINNGSNGHGKCIFLFTDKNRYLFNCPEDAGRTIRISSSFRVNRLQDVFVTRKTWANIGGLPGMGLTLKQAGQTQVTIHGPSNIDAVFKSTNCMYDGSPPVKIVQRHHSMEMFEDNSLIIKYLPLFGKRKVRVPLSENETQDDFHDLSVAYVCTLKQRPGRMNIAQCIKLGVPVGPLLGKLQKGEDVTLEDGRLVKSSDVLNEPEQLRNFAVVDIDDEFFLKSLLDCDRFDEFFQLDEKSDCKIDLIIHYTNGKMFEMDSYQLWMKKFGPKTQHLVVNELAPEYCHNGGVFSMQAQLNHMNEDVFPLLSCHRNTPSTFESSLVDSVVKAEPNLTYHFRPFNKFIRDDKTDIVQSREPHIKALYENENFSSIFDHYKDRRKKFDLEQQNEFAKEYPEVIFLGTCSAIQTKYRNVSGILVHISDYRSILLDCGEGTLHQLYQFYDRDTLPRVLTNIKLIFISHLHADHHLGLFTLLQKRKEAFDQLDLNFEPVHLIGPSELFKIQHLYSQHVDDIMPLAKRLTSNGENEPTLRGLMEIRRRLGLNSLFLVKVSHPKNAFGLIFRMPDGYKVVYSGDTLQCPKLVTSGIDADLLIHEATLDDSRHVDAKLKYHCTMSQAYDVAKKMRAKFTILTHFSGRYAQLPLHDESFLKDKDVFFAFDFTRFKPGYTLHMAYMIPLLKAAFSRHYADAVMKREFHEYKLKRENDEKIREMKLRQKMILNS